MHRLLIVSLAGTLCGQIPPESADVLRVIENAYAANRESVDHCKATFIWMEGTAASPEAARRGEIADVMKGNGTYVFNGPKKKYELLLDRDDVIAHTAVLDAESVSTPTYSQQFLTDGRHTLHNQPIYNPATKSFGRSASITEDMEQLAQAIAFPLGLGNKGRPAYNDIANELRRARIGDLEGLESITVERDVLLDGGTAHKVTFNSRQAGVTYWVDPKRGCVPVQVRARMDGLGETHVTYYDQLSLVDGKAWIPMRVVHFLRPGARPIVRVFQIVSIDLAHPPRDQDFNLSFPEPTSVLDFVTGRKYAGKKTFSLSELSHPSAKGSRPVVIEHSSSPSSIQLPGPIESTRWWPFGVPVLLIGLALIVARRLWRKER